MPVLSNAKHERFAQEIAKGKSASESYVLAGYKAHDGNASTLRGNQKVEGRVAELLERAAIKVELTVADIVEELEQARKIALSAATPQSGAAVAASMGKAKVLGLITDKSEVAGPNGGPIPFTAIERRIVRPVDTNG